MTRAGRPWRAAFLALAVSAPISAAGAQPAPPKPPLPQTTVNSMLAIRDAPDAAYGAYQRGYYLTAFAEASKRAQQNDPAAMMNMMKKYDEAKKAKEAAGEAVSKNELPAKYADSKKSGLSFEVTTDEKKNDFAIVLAD